jgi:probable rRNA maturation factor
MKVSLDINVPSRLWRGLPRARAIARETIAAAVAESAGVARADGAEEEASQGAPSGAELSICLADDATLHALNLRWRGVDKPTNVLSFPAAPRDRLQSATTLGDIALAYETLACESDDLGISRADHYRHLLVHGFLHLIGYDHETDAEAERMEALETRILTRLEVSDPYAREVVGG